MKSSDQDQAQFLLLNGKTEKDRRLSRKKRHLENVLRFLFFFGGITKFKSSDRSRTPRDWLQTYYESGSTLECLQWMFEAQDQGLIRQVAM